MTSQPADAASGPCRVNGDLEHTHRIGQNPVAVPPPPHPLPFLLSASALAAAEPSVTVTVAQVSRTITPPARTHRVVPDAINDAAR